MADAALIRTRIQSALFARIGSALVQPIERKISLDPNHFIEGRMRSLVIWRDWREVGQCRAVGFDADSKAVVIAALRTKAAWSTK